MTSTRENGISRPHSIPDADTKLMAHLYVHIESFSENEGPSFSAQVSRLRTTDMPKRLCVTSGDVSLESIDVFPCAGHVTFLRVCEGYIRG